MTTKDLAALRTRVERFATASRFLCTATALHPFAELVPGKIGAAMRAVTSIGGDRVLHVFTEAFNGWHAFNSRMARLLAQDHQHYRIANHQYVVADFRGVPVMWQTDWSTEWIWSPLPRAELLARTNNGGPVLLTRDSRSNGFTLSADTTPIPDLMNPAAVDAIAKTSRANVCRSWLFVGPPGSGKTTAARQLVSAVGRGAWVQLGPDVLDNPEAWDVVHEIKPTAIMLDDIDTNSGALDESIRTGLTVARTYAKVIAATANTTTDLRGSLLRPGRFDEDPVLIERLDAETMSEIGRSVPLNVIDAAADAGLLAAYLSELNYRVNDGRDPRSELDKLIARMRAAGDR